MKTKALSKLIPDKLLIDAANRVGEILQEAGVYCCADKWGESQKALCRSLLPDEYHHIETDLIGHRVISLRKAGKLNGDKKRARKAYKLPSGKYAEYLQSDHWLEFRQEVMRFWDYSCCICCSPKKLEVHHRTYARVGRERLTDCVVLCQTCHRRVHGNMFDGHDYFEPKKEATLWQ